jgi:hypothetical protein
MPQIVGQLKESEKPLEAAVEERRKRVEELGHAAK